MAHGAKNNDVSQNNSGHRRPWPDTSGAWRRRYRHETPGWRAPGSVMTTSTCAKSHGHVSSPFTAA